MSLSASYLIAGLSDLDLLQRRPNGGRSEASLDVAFTARALHLVGDSGSEAAFEILAKCRTEEADLMYWRSGPHSSSPASLTATSLALLMYADRGELMTDKIVAWVNEMRLQVRIEQIKKLRKL